MARSHAASSRSRAGTYPHTSSTSWRGRRSGSKCGPATTIIRSTATARFAGECTEHATQQVRTTPDPPTVVRPQRAAPSGGPQSVCERLVAVSCQPATAIDRIELEPCQCVGVGVRRRGHCTDDGWRDTGRARSELGRHAAGSSAASRTGVIGRPPATAASTSSCTYVLSAAALLAMTNRHPDPPTADSSEVDSGWPKVIESSSHQTSAPLACSASTSARATASSLRV